MDESKNRRKTCFRAGIVERDSLWMSSYSPSSLRHPFSWTTLTATRRISVGEGAQPVGVRVTCFIAETEIRVCVVDFLETGA